MAGKVPEPTLSLFKEMRANFDSPLGTILQIQISQPGTFSRRQPRRIVRSHHLYDTPATFSEHYLASSTSFFHSTSPTWPRCFLWRIVQGQKVLELRSVDLSKSVEERRETIYAVQFVCNERFKLGGIALADTDNNNVVRIFALTKSNELYTISFRKDIVCDLKASDEEVAKWCKISSPVTFTLSSPHTLIAISSTRLLVSLSDGRLLHLSRRDLDIGSSWDEVTYSDGKWTSSLRGLVRWQGSNTVQYDGAVLEQSTPLSLAMSPGKEHVFAVCMSHTLRAWNIRTGIQIFSQDILGKRREQHELARFSLDPSAATYLQIIDLPRKLRGFEYCAVTYSPIDIGEFKFWGARDANFGEKGLVDAFPDAVLHPPDPDANAMVKAKWEVVDFKVRTDSDEPDKELALWILMRSSRYFRLYKLQFTFGSLAGSWGRDWLSVVSYTETDSVPNSLLTDTDDEWFEDTLISSKYPAYVVESALLMYQASLMKSTRPLKGPLRERLVSAVNARAQQSSNPVSDDHAAVIHQEWTILWQYVRDLDITRRNAKTLVLDPLTGVPWVALSDGCSLIRSGTRLEKIANNEPAVLEDNRREIEMPSVESEYELPPKLPDVLAVVLKTATMFGQSLGPDMRQALEFELSHKFWQERPSAMSDRLQELSESCRFSEVEDGRLLDIDQSLEPIEGIPKLETDMFFNIIDASSPGFSGIASDLLYTKFGMRTLIEGAREIIYQRQKMFIDLLALVVFLTTEVDTEETPMEYFDGPQIFEGLVNCIKQHQLLKWLVDHDSSDGRKSDDSKEGGAGGNSIDWRPTILEIVFAINLQPHSSDTSSAVQIITEDIQDLLRWTIGGNDVQPAEDIVIHILCSLVQRKNVYLADQLEPLLPRTPWAIYVSGRLDLLKDRGERSASSFERAATELSKKDNFNKLALQSLLSPKEAAHFGQGLPNYYTHIIDLFEAASPAMPAETTHFANLALAKVSKNVSVDQLSQLLGSLFSASLKMADFDAAHSALTRHPSPETLLPEFIKTILNTPKANSRLLSLAWPADLHRHIDVLLAKEAKPKLLAAWRLQQNDFPGAASALLPSLNALQANVGTSKGEEKDLENQYLTIINLLECAGKENAWLLSGGSTEVGGGSKEKRKVVTVDDLRASYQKELDRRSLIDRGNFSFTNGGALTNDNALNGEAMDLL